MNRLRLLLGTTWARAIDADYSTRPRRCNGCRRAVHMTRRGPAGVTGCTSCIPATWPGVPHDQF